MRYQKKKNVYYTPGGEREWRGGIKSKIKTENVLKGAHILELVDIHFKSAITKMTKNSRKPFLKN